jgi:hypothetical protein
MIIETSFDNVAGFIVTDLKPGLGGPSGKSAFFACLLA